MFWFLGAVFGIIVGLWLLGRFDEWLDYRAAFIDEPEPEPLEWKSCYAYPPHIELMIENIDIPLIEVVWAVEDWMQPYKSASARKIVRDLDWVGNLDFYQENGVLPQDYYRSLNDPRRSY